MSGTLAYAWRVATWLLCSVLVLSASSLAVRAEEAAATKIAVFDFELEDKSAGGGIIPPDEHDIRYLGEATAQAIRMLTETKRFSIVDTKNADVTAVGQFGLRNCGGCEAGIAQKLGAQFTLLGVVTRVNRTEHTLLIRIVETASGQLVATGFTDLRMGANYAWPRSAKWVMENRILAVKK